MSGQGADTVATNAQDPQRTLLRLGPPRLGSASRQGNAATCNRRAPYAHCDDGRQPLSVAAAAASSLGSVKTAMSVPAQSFSDSRDHQRFPKLEPAEIERVRRFGEVRSYAAGEALTKAGTVGHGIAIILAGTVDITQHDQWGRRTLIVSHGPGSVIGELAQVAGGGGAPDAPAGGAGGGLV